MNISSAKSVFSNQPRFFYVPEGLDLTGVVPSRLIPAALYLIDTIYWRRITHWHGRNFVPLKREYLRQVMGQANVGPIVDALHKAKIIEVDPSYSKGRKSIGYRLSEQWHNTTHRKTAVTSSVILKRLAKVDQARRKEITLDVHQHLHRHLQRIQVTSTHDPALQYIADKRWYFTPGDEFGRRVHTNVTNLNRNLRPYLRVDGKKLVSLDLANSQPYFLCLLLKNYYANNGDLKALNSFEFKGKYLDLETLLILDRRLNLPPDVLRYFSICSEGSLYELICEDTGLCRDDVKKQLMTAFFGENKFTNKVKKSLELHFPSVMQVVHLLKQQNHELCSCLLQRMESSVIINRIVRCIMEVLPDLFITTVHDSIVTTFGDDWKLLNIIQQVFNSFNLLPKIKTEEWSNDFLQQEAKERERRKEYYNDGRFSYIRTLTNVTIR